MNCLDCANSFSLPAGEAFDDGTVSDYDRLVCMRKRKAVADDFCCEAHTDSVQNANNEEEHDVTFQCRGIFPQAR